MSNKHPQRPPKLAERLLSRVLYDDVWKTMLGDLQEYYATLCEKEGKAKANAWYWRQVIRYTPSKIIHKLLWTSIMFKNYLKIAARNILKYKGYSSINIIGLATGLSCFLLIGLFVVHEMSYDSYHDHADSTYRLIRDVPGSSYLGTSFYAVNPMPLTYELNKDFAGVEVSTTFEMASGLINKNGGSFFEEGLFAEQHFFEIFSHDWISGSPEQALQSPTSIVLTESMAKKYFGDRNPFGEALTMTIDGKDEAELFTVTGVLKNQPSNSHIQFDYIALIDALPRFERDRTFWFNNNTHTYLRLDGTNTIPEIESKIKGISDAQLLTSSYYAKKPEERLPIYKLQHLTDVYLNSSAINFNPGPVGSRLYLYMLSGIALIILIVASINYMNLSTARSMTRAKEVGVRKVNGAFSSNISMQFISESMVFSFFAIGLALIIVWVAFPYFSGMMGERIELQFFNSITFWLAFLLIGVIVGITSGSYPALFLSRLTPIGIFKNVIKGGKMNQRLQHVLVIAQFAITNILILSSLVIFLQMDFIQTRDSGFSRDQILAVKVMDPELMTQFDVLNQRFESNAYILDVSSGSKLPTEIDGQTSGITWDGKPEDLDFDTFNGSVNLNYLEMLGIEMVAGRSYNAEMDTDSSNHFIINSHFVASVGWTMEEAVDKDVTFWGREGKIIGVVEDFNFLSYHAEMAPLLLRHDPQEDHNHMLLKIDPENLSETLAFVEKEINAFSPNYPFEYAFLDDAFNSLYETELRLGSVLNKFTLLALFIACLGLFGLASFMMERRTKEVGIRKTLGASVFQIMGLLNKSFVQLVGISFIISIPIGWYIANQWLENFAYKISVGPMIFIGMGVASFGIALLTVSYKSFKAATVNPVESLKSE
ncbi:MAG: ABC transporter permease [Bacteroidota bacterium]